MATGSEVFALALSADGSLLATGHISKVLLWDVQSRENIGQLDGEAGWLAFAPSGRFLLGGRYREAIVWDVKERAAQESLPYMEGSTVALVPGRDELVGSRLKPTRYELASLAKLCTYEASLALGDWWQSVAVSRDGRLVAAGTGRGKVVVWELESAREVSRFPAGAHCAHDVAFSPDGQSLAVGGRSGNGPLMVWDVRTGQARKELRSPANRSPTFADRLEYSADGRFLLDTARSLDVKGKARPDCWEVESETLLPTIHWLGAAVRATAFSPDGRHLVTGDRDGKVRFWPVAILQDR
jgi:WD40 repeat protein